MSEIRARGHAVDAVAVPRMHFDIEDTRIEITTATPDVLFDRISALLTVKRGFALATLNLDHLVKLRSDPAFRAAYAQHDIIVADGNPIVWMSRLARRPVALMPGSDLIDPLAGLAAQLGVPVAFFGSNSDVLDQAALALQRQHPGLTLSATIAPPMGFDPTGAAAEQLLDQLVRSGTGLCLIALGAPKQERFAAFARQRAPHIGFVSIGAGLDFIAGHQTRAPKLIRALALEWLWRMILTPKRLALRYMRCGLVLPGQIRQAWQLRYSAE